MLSQIEQFLAIIRPVDILDILLVAYITYKGITLLKETRAEQLLKGILVFVVVTQVSHWLSLNSLSFILRNAMQVGMVALVVVFQPELRRALEQMGRSALFNITSSDNDSLDQVINEIGGAVEYLAKQKIGALIVLERDTKIGDIIRTGSDLDANVSAELLISIFIPNTPLHDGAVIIRENKIKAAGCLLPLTQNENLSRELGTRHRAALGISESSDVVVVVVSEETGKISFAKDGDMSRSLSVDTLKLALSKTLSPTRKKNYNFNSRFRKGGAK